MWKATMSGLCVAALFVADARSIRAQDFTTRIAFENGDTNGDWEHDLSDGVYLLAHLFLGGPQPVPIACGGESPSSMNGDTNGDGTLDVSDAVRHLGWLFSGGPPPVTMTCGLLAEGAGASATRRPIEDFLDTQGSFCVDDGGGGCLLFVPPDPNFLGWTEAFTDAPNLLFAGVDYAGLADGYPDREPSIRGRITERGLSDGSALVHVVMQTTGANAWVIDIDLNGDVLDQIANKPTLFGHRPRDVLDGAGQALADTVLEVVFMNSAPGDPLPDLIEFNQGRAGLRFIRFGAHAQGPLSEEFGVPEGTPGTCAIQQTGILESDASANSALADGFPAELIRLREIDN